MGVATKIAQHLHGATESGLSIDHPVVAVQAADELRELPRICKSRSRARTLELLAAVEALGSAGDRGPYADLVGKPSKWSVKLPRNRLRGSVGLRFPQDLAWRTKREYLDYNPVVGGERASSVRQRYAGKICCECKAPLPPPHRRGERLCQRCAGVSMKRVFLQFSFRQGWFCEFLEEDRKTRLPRTVMLPDERQLFELVKRGGFTLNISGRQEIEDAIRKKGGGVWLELTPEQYAKLLQPAAN